MCQECGGNYCVEIPKDNAFWADVYYYMEDHDCNKETAIKAIAPLYPELFDKKTESKVEQTMTITTIKLKDDVDFKELEAFGFMPDPVNCEPGDHYYSMNNYYAELGEHFRAVVNLLDRSIHVFCLPSGTGLHNTTNMKPLFDLLSSNLVEEYKSKPMVADPSGKSFQLFD